MKTEETPYEKILDILKRSKTVLRSTDDIEENVINMILQKQKKEDTSFSILDFLFGWVYVGWVRRGLVTASLLLIIAFAYQQTVILKRVNNLNRQNVFIESQMITGISDNAGEKLLYRLAGGRLTAGNITISEKQIEQVMGSYNQLQEKYRDLIKLIEEDPELKDYIEKKLNENDKKKFNL